MYKLLLFTILLMSSGLSAQQVNIHRTCWGSFFIFEADYFEYDYSPIIQRSEVYINDELITTQIGGNADRYFTIREAIIDGRFIFTDNEPNTIYYVLETIHPETNEPLEITTETLTFAFENCICEEDILVSKDTLCIGETLTLEALISCQVNRYYWQEQLPNGAWADISNDSFVNKKFDKAGEYNFRLFANYEPSPYAAIATPVTVTVLTCGEIDECQNKIDSLIEITEIQQEVINSQTEFVTFIREDYARMQELVNALRGELQACQGVIGGAPCEIQVAPNPADYGERILVKAACEGEAFITIVVVNLQGNVISLEHGPEGTYTLPTLQPGTYYLQIKIESDNYEDLVTRIVIINGS